MESHLLISTQSNHDMPCAHLFDPNELAAIKAKQGLALACARTQALREQGSDCFCVNKNIAELWHRNNGGSLLLPHAGGADLLRSHDVR
jgi:hypothetical protein